MTGSPHIIVIGAGSLGLCTAVSLAEQDAQVTVLEAKSIDADEPGLVTGAGAGGYGIPLSPVIGQIAADWALHGAPVSPPGVESLAPSATRNVAS